MSNSTATPMLVVASRQDFADRFAMALAAFLSEDRQPLTWSAPDPLPYEQLPHDVDLTSRRVAVLRQLRNSSEPGPIIVTTPRALVSFIRSPETFDRDTITISTGDRLDDRRFLDELVRAGYQVEPLVDVPGTIARRGGIVDVFSPGTDLPFRIEFFGDDVESLRTFDPESQRSVDQLSSVTILPPLEFDLEQRTSGLERLQRLDLSTLRPEVLDEWTDLLLQLELGGRPQAVDLLATAFPDNAATLLDYLPTWTTVTVLDADSTRLEADQLELRAREVRSTLVEAGEIPDGIIQPYESWQAISDRLGEFNHWEIGSASSEPTEVVPSSGAFQRAPVFAGNAVDAMRHIHARLQDGWRFVVATEQSERVRDILVESDIYPRIAKRSGSGTIDPPQPGTIDVVHAVLDTGFSLPEPKLSVLTDFELFGIRQLARPVRRAQVARHKSEAFSPGSYVVHVEHGIGIYQGLVTLDTDGISREYLQVDYAANDRLYVPVDQSNRLARYDAPGGAPRVTRLSSTEWNRATARARHAVRELAFDLLKLYADRELASGHQYPPDSLWDIELAESFPFRETLDQQTAISDVRQDLESPQPMDRLVCGDVGYGKTEVALRAAFKAVNDGRQVAILVPTTVLALQHYENFRERLAAFPVTIEMLSRLRTRAEQRKILEDLESGAVDIVIGTHRILQRDVRFKKLGMLVVDEEQRFGVQHKEQIKRLRTDIDVLTMTATPIPRTLYMALTELRDLSLISTPPRDRVPIRTFVTARDDNVIREAVIRELSRGGQVFFVHNRVQSIYRVAEEIREQIPEARIGIGHGQMNEKELEAVVLAFIQHQYDVLVCTTIIESGVDIPNANTIIMDNAHALGLTQLYQLRGRVGRGSNRAYAYLLYPPFTPLSPVSRQRLAAIQEATELGAGFQIAMRDMEIRGVGNVLGAEQSGHIGAIGLDLYTRMLSSAVDEIRTGHPIVEPEEVQLDIAIDARIPTSYIEEESLRLSTYQHIAGAKNAVELRDARNELIDRFGPIPDAVRRIFDLVRLRLRAMDLGVLTVIERSGEIYIRPVVGNQLNQNQLRRELGDGVRVTPNQVRLVVNQLEVGNWDAISRILDAVEEAKLAAPAR